MATVADILTFSRAQAQTDSNGLTDANGIVFANEALLDFHRQLISRGVDASQLQEAYRDGTANVGTYLYPTDMFFLKAIELNYADTEEQNYKVADQVDVSNLSGDTSFGWFRKNASKDDPKFDDRGDWYEIFPTPASTDNLTALIRIFYFKEPTEYAATTDTLAYPVNLDYRIIGWKVVASYLFSKGKTTESVVAEGKYQSKIKELISTLSRGVQSPIQATPIQLSGWEF